MNKLISWVKEHKVISIIIGFVVLIVVIGIILAIFNNSDQTDKYNKDNALSQVQDSNTPEDIPTESKEIPLLGFDDLYSEHSNSWFAGISAVVRLYSRTINLKIETISLTPGSHKVISNKDISSETMIISLNNQQNSYQLEITGENKGFLYSLKQDNKTVFERVVSIADRYVINNGELLDWLNVGPQILFTLTDDNIPETIGDLPSIKINDKIRAYFACPIPNQNDFDNCYIYKYDFYY